MNGLISSFLVDPVVRHARRVSTSADAMDTTGGVGTSYSEDENLSIATDLDQTQTHISLHDSTSTHMTLSPSNETDLVSDPSLAGHVAALGNSGEYQATDSDLSHYAQLSYGFSSLLTYSRELIETLTSRYPAFASETVSSSTPSSVLPAMSDQTFTGSNYDVVRRFSADFVQRLRNEDRAILGPPERVRAEIATSSRRVSLDQDPASLGSGMSDTLPDDDGMRLLRNKIHMIKEMALSSEEKARRMHALMIADYEAFRAQSSTASPQDYSDQSYKPEADPDVGQTPISPASTSFHNGDDLAFVSPLDCEPTYPPSSITDDCNVVSHSNSNKYEADADEEVLLGCKHYLRNVKIQCCDCKKWYTCRHCHDAAENHPLDTKRIQNMLCMLCGHPQRAQGYCEKCGEVAAAYYCDVCKLWENDTNKSIYHCEDCGICRRGEGLGKDYLHCKKCNVCISIAWIDAHRCVERATECDCPICNIWMFTSSDAVVSMRCGHYIHRQCYDEYMKTSYKCPICNRSAVNMELQWRKLNLAIQTQPMPSQYSQTKVWITCNDCAARTCTSYHWLGNKCAVCDSYNTSKIKLINGPSEDEAEAVTNSPEAIVLREIERNLNEPEFADVPEPALSDVVAAALRDGRMRDSQVSSFSQDVPETYALDTQDVDRSRNMIEPDELQSTNDTSVPSHSREPIIRTNRPHSMQELHQSSLSMIATQIERGQDLQEYEDGSDEDDINFWGEGISPGSWSMPLSISPMSGWTSPGFLATRIGHTSGGNQQDRDNDEDLLDGDEDDDDWSTDRSEDNEPVEFEEDGDVEQIELFGHR